MSVLDATLRGGGYVAGFALLQTVGIILGVGLRLREQRAVTKAGTPTRPPLGVSGKRPWTSAVEGCSSGRWRRDSPAVVELGYRLNQAAWGRGYATEGSQALVHKGFTGLEVERVTANTMAVNTRSRRVMEKSGLSFIRNFTGDWPEQIEGSEHGEVEHELSRTEWEQSQQASTA